jgi:putative ABC transport system permease protein
MTAIAAAAPSAGLAIVPARWMMGGEWRAHPARLITAALAIAVGVALGFAVHLVNRSALASFDAAITSVNGAADLQIRAVSPAGFAEAIYPRIATEPGVIAASPVVELDARIDGLSGGGQRGAGRIVLLGLDLLRAAAVTPGLVGLPPRAGPGSENPFQSDSIFLSRTALTASGRKLGDSLTIIAAGQSRRLRIAGTIANDARAIAVIDIAEAQWQFGQLGRLHRIDLRLAQYADRDAIGRRLSPLLPADAKLVSAELTAERSDSLSRAYRVNLEMLAMVALLTGGFLVFSAQSLSVARRQPQFALLRVLGLARGALLSQIIVEGAIVGSLGAAIGVALGYGLAALALHLLGGDLGGGYFGRTGVNLAFAPGAALVFAGFGIATAIIASLIPAREAALAQPAIALKGASDTGDPRRQPRGWPGLALIAAGGLAALAPPVAGLPLFGYAAMALLLAGGVATMPFLARAILLPLQGLSLPPALDLARKRLWGAPHQAAIALCGIVASTSLMVAMAVMVSSFRGSVDDWLVQILPSDIYMHLEATDGGGLTPEAQTQLKSVPGIARLRFVRQIPLRLATDKPDVSLSGEPQPALRLPLVAPALSPPPGAIAAYVSEPMTWLYGTRPGDTLLLPLAGRQQPVFVAGVWRDYARQFGAVTLDDKDFVRLTGDATKNEAAIDILHDASAARVIAGLRNRLPPGLAAQSLFGEPRQMRRIALQVFDRSFAITYALEAIAISIGLVGVAATFSAQTLARTREFGMLRHIGVRRGQIIAMLAAEGGLLGLVGGLGGLGLGLVMSQVLIHVINPQSFHWTMDTRLPLPLLGLLLVALILAAAGTALVAGHHAVTKSAIRAVREDW